MTLVLTHLSDDYAIQVSDRRLTWGDGRLADSASNKCVVWGATTMFAYTGFSKLDGVMTDLWLGEVLVSCGSLDEAEQKIIARTRESIERFRGVPGERRWHAFVGVTWSLDPPAVISISNFQDGAGRWQAAAQDTFTVVRLPLERGARLHVAGQALRPQDEAALTQRINELLAANHEPAAIADRLVGEVRRVSAINRRVGPDVLVTSLPRQALGTSGEWDSARANRTSRSAYYVPAGSNSPVIYGPTLVSPGMMIGRPEIWMNEKPPWWTDQ